MKLAHMMDWVNQEPHCRYSSGRYCNLVEQQYQHPLHTEQSRLLEQKPESFGHQCTEQQPPIHNFYQQMVYRLVAEFKIFVKNSKLQTKNSIYTKIQILAKSQIQSKIEILVKKWKFKSKIEILVKNRYLRQKSKSQSKIEILVKNRNFSQKSKFYSKIEILVNNCSTTKCC